MQNTKKITKAMELVAAAKMRRAVAAALKTRAYANLAWNMINALRGAATEETHPLLRGSSTMSLRGAEPQQSDAAIPANTPRVLYVVMASDRGLCGGFNAQLFRALLHDVQSERPAAGSLQLVAIGRKAEQFIRRQGWNLSASFTNIAVAPTVAETRPIARLAMDAFTSGAVDEVRIAFTDFVSSLRQQPRVRTLLPLQRIEEIGVEAEERRVGAPSPSNGAMEFLFEPSPAIVLDAMLPRVVELQTYQCYLETGASEYSARMFAMRSASDAAGEMIDDLSFTFNQARQSLITREIAEISAGRVALQSA